MKATQRFLAALAILAAGLMPQASHAAGAGVYVDKQSWSFAGVFGSYDQNQLQRGFQVFREVCASCHGARLMAFRNLSEPGGPGFSEAQVRALAATYQVQDETAPNGRRPAVPADRWPSPYANEREARESNGGAFPPDFSVLAKARGVTDDFPYWVFNYFTGYQEGGVDYIHGLLLGYEDAPADFELSPGQYYNAVFPGHSIAMGQPVFNGQVRYAEAHVPQTVDQYSKDVAAFMMWMAEPHLNSRKQTGFQVMLFLFLFAGLMWATKRRIWKGIEH